MKPKLTFIFAAMLGVASAVQAEEKPEPMWSIDFGSVYANNYEANYEAEGLGGALSVTFADVSATYTDGVKGHIRINDSASAGLGVSVASEFTLVVTAVIAENTNLSGWPVLFSIGENDNWCLKVNINGSGEFHFDADARNGNTNYTYLVNGTAVNNHFVVTPGEHIFALTLRDTGEADAQNRKNGIATLYVDGNLAYAQEILKDRRNTSSIYKWVSLGERIGNNANKFPDVTFNGVEMYSGAMTQSQVIKYVPEPATATLSLLALAGLAARRRRK